jgi:hypothetical protein
LTNLQKYVADLVPGDDSSTFDISSVNLADSANEDGTITIRWPTALHRVYRIYVNSDLRAPWPIRPAFEVVGNGQMAVYTYISSNSAPMYFKLTVDLVPD